MPSTEEDMLKPVTRAELRLELGELRLELATKAELREELANHPTKAELREELANHATKSEVGQLRQEVRAFESRTDTKFASIDAKLDILAAQLHTLGATLQTLVTKVADQSRDIAQFAKTGVETFLSQLSGYDERYADLPRRVTRLENRVFKPKRSRRRPA